TRILAEHLYKTNQQLETQAEALQDQAEELQQQSEELQDQTEELQQSSEELQVQNLELDAQKAKLEVANKLKSEFLSNMSHELRTPLNSIMALSSVLLTQAKDKLNEEENGYLEIVERNGKRLLSLINDILDLSKIEAGRMDILPEFVSLGSLLQIMVENMQVLCDEKGLAISLSIPDDLPKVETDASKLHQILTNIVGNAVKFTENGGIEVSVRRDKESVIIDVKDSGIGISEEMLLHVFDEFRQADGSSSRLYEGTGLGLAIASKLAIILGGDISVQSEAGKGSVFSITIPFKWHEKRLISGNDAIEAISWQDMESTNTPDKDISEARILIVEDNPDHMITIKAVLKGKYNIDEASDVEEALMKVITHKPEIVLLDMSLPEMSGEQAVKALKENSVMVIAVTAQAMKGDREKFMKIGCDGYVSKPINQEALLEEILRLSKLSKL
ncbi:MAG: ATP-binding protein, partial [Bacteroidota bacterium]|nr:ATP-binding protein [Bacteroidota bacterium]